MRKLIGVSVLSAIALSLPQVGQAQRRATSTSMGGAEHELGVDLGVAYFKPSNFSGGIAIVTPLDVRFGIVPRSGKLMWEPHVALNFNSAFGATRYIFTPGIHALYANSVGGHRRGMYFNGGAGLVLGDEGAGTGTAVNLEAGVGWRKPYGSGAWRYEIGFQWVSSSTKLEPLFANYIAIGGRIGISLWH